MKQLKKFVVILIIMGVIAVCSFSQATTGTVSSNAARVRESASTSATVLTVIYPGDEVQIDGEEGDWYKVTVNGQTGYVSKSLISTSDSSSSSSSSNTSTNTSTGSTNTNSSSNTSASSTSSNDSTTSSSSSSDNTTANTSAETNTATSTNVTNTSTTSVYETTTNETSTNTTVTSNTATGEVTTSGSTTKTATVTEDIWIKLLPNFGSNNLSLLESGDSVEVGSELNNWVKVTSGGTSGWILKNKITYSSTSTVTEEDTTETDTTTSETETETTDGSSSDSDVGKTGTINVETANVRETASSSAEIVGHLDEGDEVTIIAEDGDWYQITGSGIESGYVAQRLVNVSD